MSVEIPLYKSPAAYGLDRTNIWWQNLEHELSRTRPPRKMYYDHVVDTLASFNACISSHSTLVFESQEDLTVFLLRWS